MDHDPDYEPIRALIASVEAPLRLRERVVAERERHAMRGMLVRRAKLTGAIAGFAAALGIAAALIVPAGNGVNGPSVTQLAALAGRGATAPAPAVDPADPTLLRAKVQNVSFPRWSGRLSWRATGQRSDSVGGRHAVTVFYQDPRGVRLGYTILAGAAMDWSPASRKVVSNGVEVHVQQTGGRVIAEWRERGHSCVISAAASVPESRMVFLASHDYAS
jgi:hypothetical protein